MFVIELSVNEDGFWLANIRPKNKRNPYRTNYGEISATPEEALATLLKAAGIETRTGAMVLEAAE